MSHYSGSSSYDASSEISKAKIRKVNTEFDDADYKLPTDSVPIDEESSLFDELYKDEFIQDSPPRTRVKKRRDEEETQSSKYLERDNLEAFRSHHDSRKSDDKSHYSRSSPHRYTAAAPSQWSALNAFKDQTSGNLEPYTNTLTTPYHRPISPPRSITYKDTKSSALSSFGTLGSSFPLPNDSEKSCMKPNEQLTQPKQPVSILKNKNVTSAISRTMRSNRETSNVRPSHSYSAADNYGMVISHMGAASALFPITGGAKKDSQVMPMEYNETKPSWKQTSKGSSTVCTFVLIMIINSNISYVDLMKF